MYDLETIRKYIRYYNIELKEEVDKSQHWYAYNTFIDTDVYTKKGFERKTKKDPLFRNSIVKCNNYGLMSTNVDDILYDLCREENKVVFPPMFYVILKPIVQRAVYQEQMKVVWEPQAIPDKCLMNYINLPQRELFFKETIIYDLMTREIRRYMYDMGDDMIVIKVKNEVCFDVRKLYNVFRPVFDEIGLYVPLEEFRIFYETKTLKCSEHIDAEYGADEEYEQMIRNSGYNFRREFWGSWEK